jgi:hypothetical protein
MLTAIEGMQASSARGILFDLLQTSSLLRAHVADGKVFFGGPPRLSWRP